MMQILSAQQIRDWDTATINAQGITSIALMERAATACVEWITSHYTANVPFLVLCGTGNNGGDGLAITRLLSEKGYGVEAFVIRDGQDYSPDCNTNLNRLKSIDASLVQELDSSARITELGAEVIIIDALFGTGMNRPLAGNIASFIAALGRLPNHIISIDMPSGLMAGGPMPEGSTVVKAKQTLTFQVYKRSLMHPETGKYAGQVHVLDIGLDQKFTESVSTPWHTIDQQMVKGLYRPREAFSHKGTYGTAFVIGGSYGLLGAIILAAQAAGRAGAGKVRALAPQCGYTVLQTAAPEAMCKTSGEQFIKEIDGWESSSGIGIGPGLGDEVETVAAFRTFLEKVDKPIVLDADAINILGKYPDLIRHIPRHSILTPHPKEFERLAGETPHSFERAEKARAFARQHEVYIVLKDKHTIVLTPAGQGLYNLNGNAGLATGGSGDVLCGIVTALLAQNYDPSAAALLGVWLHAAAGDAALKKIGAMEAIVAGNIVDAIGDAFALLNKADAGQA